MPGDAAPPLSTRVPGWAVGVGAALVAAAGFAVAGLASLVSRIVWRLGSFPVPWGLALAVGGSMAVVVLARALGRGAGFVAALGWLAGLFYVFSPRREGDYVIAGDALGYSFLALSVVGVMVAAAWGSAR